MPKEHTVFEVTTFIQPHEGESEFEKYNRLFVAVERKYGQSRAQELAEARSKADEILRGWFTSNGIFMVREVRPYPIPYPCSVHV